MKKGFLLKGFYTVLISGLGVQCVKRKVENTNTKSESSPGSTSNTKSLVAWNSTESLGKSWVWQRKAVFRSNPLDRRCPKHFLKLDRGNEFKLFQVVDGVIRKDVLWGVFCIDSTEKKGYLYTGEVDNTIDNVDQVKATAIVSVELEANAKRQRIPEKFKINEDKLNCSDPKANELIVSTKDPERGFWGHFFKYVTLQKQDFYTQYNMQQCDLSGEELSVKEFGMYFSFPALVVPGLFTEIGLITRIKGDFPKFVPNLTEQDQKDLQSEEAVLTKEDDSAGDILGADNQKKEEDALPVAKPEVDANLLTGFYSRPWQAQWVVHDHRKDIKETHLALIVLNPMVLELSRRIHSGEPSSTSTEAPKP
jgi:hypothetical protein